jgi:diguanylate cyclase (GGDEF)-like protein
MACILVPVAIRCFGLIQGREYLLLGALTLSFMVFLLNCINSCARLFAEKSRAVDDLQKSLEKTEIAKLELEHAALHDALTGLPNRRAFLNHLTLAAASDVSRPALFYIDLDRFKPVNDSFGHVVGDKLLEAVALRLRTCLQPGNFIARLGGDEFTFIASVADEDVAERRATSILGAICRPYCIEGHEITLGAGIGIAVGTEETNDTAALLKMADLALHESKQRGGNRYCCYQPSMLAKVNARRDNEKALVLALVEDQFELHYQPIFDLSSLNVVAAEALIRWRRPRRGLVFPEEFLPLAEEMQLIQSIGAWVLDRACSDAVQWPDGLRVAVNLSAKQVAHLEIASTISTTLAATNLAPNRLELEITESAVLGDDDLTKRRLLDLKSLGITLAVDDFGTGYSSLAYLSRFPFDRIKIDRAFVGGLVEDRGSESIVRATVDMAKGFGMQTTAEGVETRQQFFTLRKLGIDLGQGYLFSRPLPAKDFAKFLSHKTNLKPSNLIEQNDFLLRSA